MVFDKFVRALAHELATILPEGISVSADAWNVIVRTRWGYDWLNVVDNLELNIAEGWDVEEAVQQVVFNKMQELQDVVTEHLTIPWPQAPGMGRGEFVWPEVEVTDGVLWVWFGDRAAPLLPIVRVELD